MASADPMIRRQQLAIAESLLREVQLMPSTWCDPDDANVETATSAAVSATGCAATVENSGPESGETRYGPTNYFDNVNDYAGFSMTGIRDFSDAAVAGLSGYTASVAVVPDTLDSLTAGSGDALKITVTVSGPDSSSLVLQGWRTRYAPTSPY
jgi:MSHA pilin protein MshD